MIVCHEIDVTRALRGEIHGTHDPCLFRSSHESGGGRAGIGDADNGPGGRDHEGSHRGMESTGGTSNSRNSHKAHSMSMDRHHSSNFRRRS